MVLAYAVFALARPSSAEALAALLQGPAGFANGVVTGLTGSQVMPLLPYMMSLELQPDRFVQAVNLSVLLSSLVLAAALAVLGGGSALVRGVAGGDHPGHARRQVGTCWRR